MLMIDMLIVGVVAVSALIGLFRGFFPELLSLASWIVAVWAGFNFSGFVEPFLTGKLGSPMLELWLSRGIVFIAVLLIGGLIGQLVALLIRKTGLSGTDRSLGLVFGLARGIVVFGIAVMFAGSIDMTEEPWWQESRFIPYGVQVADWIRNLLPEEIVQHLPEVEVTPLVEPAGPPEQT